MVIVLPAAQRRPSKSQRIGEALSGALISGLGAYQEQHKKKQYNQALKNVEGIYGNQDLSDQQKLVQTYQQLSEHPELAKQLGGQLSRYGRKPLSPLEEAQRQKLLLENKAMQGEEDYFNRLMGGNQKDTDDQPDMNARPGGRTFEDEFGATPERARPGEEEAPRKSAQRKFDYNDPSSWSDKEINNFRSFEGKSPKAKTFARMAQNEYDKRQETKQSKKKYQENIAPLNSAIETLDRMEKLGKKGNLGIGTKVRGVLSSDARKHAAEYERLGKSLIQYSTNIPIRNRAEFEVLAHDLYDPSISDASREGILSAMKRIIQSSMQQYEAPEEEGVEARQPRQPNKKERPPLTSFLK